VSCCLKRLETKVTEAAEANAAMLPCTGCGAVLPREDGPTHRYLESSPACWRLYGEVLAREYSDARYHAIHRLTVDAYAVQHPGSESPQSTQSVALHLISLYLVLERGWSPDGATRALQRAAKRKKELWWLEPPVNRGAVTVADVHATSTPTDHVAEVHHWSRAAWRAWAAHHATVRVWVQGEGVESE
jgi:hypothetical protein